MSINTAHRISVQNVTETIRIGGDQQLYAVLAYIVVGHYDKGKQGSLAISMSPQCMRFFRRSVFQFSSHYEQHVDGYRAEVRYYGDVHSTYMLLILPCARSFL